MSVSAGPKTSRGVALDALVQIEHGAYANLVLPGLLGRSGLSTRDRAFTTELVYGTTRMRRACDWLLAPHVRRSLDDDVRAALRLGAYQLAVAGTPPHAAVSATVDAAPLRARGLVNAVLRKVAAATPPEWPDAATGLSYPDWVVERLTEDLGASASMAALAEMNRPAVVAERDDGYVQDEASQWVAALIGAGPGDRVADLCAAPGGKATFMAGSTGRPSLVVAGDVRETRARIVNDNARRLGLPNVNAIVADARRPPVRSAVFDRVLVDAPCSGLGALRRRPDARWRVAPDDVERLAVLQRELLQSAAGYLHPGGTLVYSACTMTNTETVAIDDWLAKQHPELVALEAPGAPWTARGRGALLLPQAAGTDGMYVLRLRWSDS
ncbi:MAG TPA: transcription antitermination factor NusB [Acidimicrobiales bacterium]